MSLEHSPSQILRQLLIDLALAGADGEAWPAYATVLPDTPDACIAVIDTAGMSRGRFSVGGEYQDNPGIQIIVRSSNFQASWSKSSAIKSALSAVHLTAVAVTDPAEYGTSSVGYVVYNVSLKSGPLPLNDPDSERKLVSLNFMATLRQIP